MTDNIRTAVADRQVIRVFISSTFRDMHAERDAINRLVFPELRRRCLMRGAEFIGVDMRWGVTEDEIRREGTLAICLHEIERSRPFFVCLLAERFGSVYPPEEVSPALVETARVVPALQSIADQWYRFDETVAPPVYRLHRALGPRMADEEAAALVRFWEARGLTGAGDSLTAREILRGVFEDGYPPTRALFYLRRSGITHQLGFPAALVPVFVEQDEERRQKLATLKRRIRRQRPRHVVQRYGATYAGLRLDPALIPPDLPANEQAALSAVVTPAQWSRLGERARDVLTQQGTVALSGMDTLAERMIEDLWRAIEPELDRPAAQLDAHQRERAYHERFVIRHTAFFRGREAESTHVLKYVGDPQDREVLVVTGDPGAGKSAFVAECVRVCRERHPEALVIPHFIGAAPESASLPATLRSLCETLRREAGLEEAVAEDPDKLRFQLRTFLEQAGAKRPIILFLDALNQLDPAGRSHELDWLSMWTPPGTRVIVTALTGDCLEQLTRRVPPDHVVTIPSLPADARRVLVTDFLARRRKTLTPTQLNELLDVEPRSDAGLPLYTLVALEELCLFGDHDALIRRIRLLPATLPELFDQVLARVEQDHTRATVEAVCSWLAVARAGLLESEVLDLLGTGGAFPRIRWTRLYRALEPYLKPIDEEPEAPTAGRLDFYHDQIRFAAYRRYLHMAETGAAATDRYREAHRQLAGYFRSLAYDETLPDKWRTERVRGLSELPFHTRSSGAWDDVASLLTDLAFVEAKCGAGMTFDLVADYRDALGGEDIDRNWGGKGAVEGFGRFVARESHLLAADASLTFQQAANQEGGSHPAREALRLLEAGKHTRPWLEWLNKPDVQSAALVTFRGHSAPVTSCRFSPDGRQIISTSEDGSVRLWDARSGRPLRTLETRRPARGGTAAYSPDGRHVVASFNDALLRSWDVESGDLKWEAAGGTLLTLSPDGHTLASRPGHRLTVWDVRSGRAIAKLSGHSDVVSFCTLAADGRRIVSMASTIRVWDLVSATQVAALEGGAFDVQFLADRAWFVSRHERQDLLDLQNRPRRTVRVWKIDANETVEFEDAAGAFACAPDGTLIAGGSWSAFVAWVARRQKGPGPFLNLWNTATGDVEAVFEGERLPEACTFSPDSTQILSITGEFVRTWEVSSHQELLAMERAGGRAVCAYSPDGRRIAFTSGHYLKVFDLGAGDYLSDIPADLIDSVTFSPDGQFLVWSGWDNAKQENLTRWSEPETGRVVKVYPGHLFGYSASGARVLLARHHCIDIRDARSLELMQRLEGGRPCAFSPSDENVVVSASARHLELRDASTGKVTMTIPFGDVQDSPSKACAFSPDGTRIISASDDGRLRVIAASRGTPESTLAWDRSRPAVACAYSADGGLIATGTRNGATLWDAVSLDQLRTLHDSVTALAFSPNGLLLTASQDRTLQLSRTDTSETVDVMRGHSASVNACAFSGDGVTAVSGSEDGTMIKWDCQRAARAAGAGPAAFISEIEASRDGRFIAAQFYQGMIGSGTLVKLFDQEGRFSAKLIGPPMAEPRLAGFLPSGRQVVAIWRSKATAVDIIGIHDCQTGEMVGQLDTHAGDARVSIAPPALGVVVSSQDVEGQRGNFRSSLIRLWDPDAGTLRTVSAEGDEPPWDCAVSPECTRLAVLNHDARILDLMTGDVVAPLQTAGGPRVPWSAGRDCRYSPDGELIGAAVDRHVVVWSGATGAMIVALRAGSREQLPRWAFSPDSRSLVFVSDDALLRVWDCRTGLITVETSERPMGYPEDCVWSPSGAWIASATGNELTLWNGRTLTSVARVRGNRFVSVRFLGDEPEVVSGDAQGVLYVLRGRAFAR